MQNPQSAPPAPPVSDIDARVTELSGQIVCNCGCGNKVVDKCFCGVAAQLRSEIRAQVTMGSTDAQVLTHFSGKYGEEILASPVPTGFNLTAWITPLTALLLGLALVGVLLSKWRRRTQTETAPPPVQPSTTASSDPYEEAFEAEYASRRD
jgi:cytochrome c-type biogenesis protein CcmH/NrfF